jgi:hypothetical protein
LKTIRERERERERSMSLINYKSCILILTNQPTNKHISNSIASESPGSSSYSQKPATGYYPGPTESTLHPPANPPKIHSDPVLPTTPWSPKWYLYFGVSHKIPEHFPLFSLEYPDAWYINIKNI